MAKSERLSAKDCRALGDECRAMAKSMASQEHRVMLQHMADTWDRIAADMEGENGKDKTDP
jgi:hypothetical protein